MADSEGGSEQDDVSFLRTVSCIFVLSYLIQGVAWWCEHPWTRHMLFLLCFGFDWS